MNQPPEKLALDGGTPVFPDGSPTWPPANEAIHAALEAVYASGDWGRYDGSRCDALRDQMSALLGVPHVQLCCSGTFAVELALRALKVAPSDEVILAAYDFGGNFRAVEDIGAVPVLVDVTPDGWSIDPDAIQSAISPRTKAVIASHLHGTLADMLRVRAVCDEHDLALVEDACQAQGAQIDGKQAGTVGDVGVWSFGGSKLLTAGRGGAIFTRDESVAQRAKVYCERANNAFPLSELQAAVLIPQLETLPQETVRRRAAVETIVRETSGNAAVTIANEVSDGHPAFYKLGIWYNVSCAADMPIDRFVAAAVAEGVDLGRGFRGFHRRPASRCRKVGSLENARRAAEETLVLHHPVLLQGEEAARRVVAALEKIVSRMGQTKS